MPRYRFRRWGRARMVEWLEARGHKVEYKNVSDSEYQQALQEKIAEEGAEVADAKTRDEIIEELADVTETIDALCQHLSIDSHDIERVKQRKIAERGTIEGGVLLTGTWVPRGSKEHQYFLDRPDIECVDEE